MANAFIVMVGPDGNLVQIPTSIQEIVANDVDGANSGQRPHLLRPGAAYLVTDLGALYASDGATLAPAEPAPGGGGGGGPTSFTDLDDAPASYSGLANNVLCVNAEETAVGVATDFVSDVVVKAGNSHAAYVTGGDGGGPVYVTGGDDGGAVYVTGGDGGDVIISGGDTGDVRISGGLGGGVIELAGSVGGPVAITGGADSGGVNIQGGTYGAENGASDVSITTSDGGGITIAASAGLGGEGRVEISSDGGSGGGIGLVAGDGGITLNTALLVLANLPTSDPAVENAVWNDAGTLKISAG
jgi:hypothetical protein